MADRLDHNFLLLGLEMRAQGQAQLGVGHFFGDGKVAGLSADAGVGSGQMRRNGIVNQGADASFSERGLQVIAPLRGALGRATGMAHGKEMPDRLGPFGNEGQLQRGRAAQFSEITAGDGARGGRSIRRVCGA